MNKRGVTLIELVVSMGIFTVIATLAVGAFVTVSRMKHLTESMREVQQKVRVSTETIERLGKQAVYVRVNNSNKTVEMFFNNKGAITASKFVITTPSIGYGEINFYDSCAVAITSYACPSWTTTPINMLKGTVYLDYSRSSFSKHTNNETGYPELNITLIGKATNIPNSPYFGTSGDLDINTNIMLENLQ